MIETLNGMTLAELMAQTPEERMAEAGNEPPCPFCERLRVRRSSYIRCNPCGKNWMEGQDIFRHPHTKATKHSSQENGDTAQPVSSTTSDKVD